jgi:dTDP-4-dehydrorhamnose 3,5-epimerase
MHFQVDPSIGPKLLTITTGSAIDVAIDLRAQSPTFGTAFTVNLRAARPVVLKIPKGFAHGYQTLENNTSLLYWLNEEVDSESGAGYNPLSTCLRDFWPISEGLILSNDDLNSPGLELEELKFIRLV